MAEGEFTSQEAFLWNECIPDDRKQLSNPAVDTTTNPVYEKSTDCSSSNFIPYARSHPLNRAFYSATLLHCSEIIK